MPLANEASTDAEREFADRLAIAQAERSRDTAKVDGVKAGAPVSTATGRVVEVASLLVDQLVGEHRAKLQRQCPERSR